RSHPLASQDRLGLFCCRRIPLRRYAYRLAFLPAAKPFSRYATAAAGIRTQSPPAVSDMANRQQAGVEPRPYWLGINTKQRIVILNAVKDLWGCKHGRIIALQIIAVQRFFSRFAPSE
ncbi:MAG: hypothetical protein IJ362_03510, partial [Oscillospiraceae bacterium]|nr:hypothetical protein [Oscillospiraceae bacterium]